MVALHSLFLPVPEKKDKSIVLLSPDFIPSLNVTIRHYV